jgi:hypothetical protein
MSIVCKSCNEEKNKDVFITVLKNCSDCRLEKSSKNKSENNNENVNPDLQKKIKITPQKFYVYLKKKYGIIEDYECMINLCKTEEYNKLQEN